MTLDLGIIRRQRYVSSVTNVTSSPYAQGGSITSYYLNGTDYIAHTFTSSGIFTITSTIYPLEFIAVAGGGGGGWGGNGAGGGGGGGRIVSGYVLNNINRVYASSAYVAVTTSTTAQFPGGWVAANTDFTGLSGSFQFNWNAIQQTGGGARTMPIPEQGSDITTAQQRYYMEIAISLIPVNTVAVGLMRDGTPKDGWGNMPYVLLSTGAVGNWTGVSTALGAFVAGDTLQIAWDSSTYSGVGTYWWVGKNGTWGSGPFDSANAGLSTSSYMYNNLRLIMMASAAAGGNVYGGFRSGSENKYPTPGGAATIGNYSGFYNNPLGTGYFTSSTTFGVTVGGGGNVGTGLAVIARDNEGAPGGNGADTVIYNVSNNLFYYSAYFANSFLTATNSLFSFGTADFSIDTWMYPTSTPGRGLQYNIRPIFNSRSFTGVDFPNRGFIVYLDFNNKVSIYTSSTVYMTTFNTVTNAVWTHLAVARIGGIMNIWINGQKDPITYVNTPLQNFTNTNIMIGFGSNNTVLNEPNYFTGYLSNYRIVKGASPYNSGISGLKAPLSAIQLSNVNGIPSIGISGTSTSLLMLTTSTSGAYTDTSLGITALLVTTSGITVSPNGPGTYSGSLSIPGSLGNFISTASSQAFIFGSGDFTVEYWVYFNVLTASTTYFVCGSGRTSLGYIFGQFGAIPYMSTSLVGYQAFGVTVNINTWYHYAWVRNTSASSGVYLYINGNFMYLLASQVANVPDVITEQGFSIGARGDNAYHINAYVSNIRVVKGFAVYTSTGTFTPRTIPLTTTESSGTNFNTINTQTVLLTFNSSTIVDISTLTNVFTQSSGTILVSTFAPGPTTSTILARAFGGGGGGNAYLQNAQAGGSGGGAAVGANAGIGYPGQGNRGGQGGDVLGSGGGGFGATGSPGLYSGAYIAGQLGQLSGGNYQPGFGGAGGYFDHSGVLTAYSGGGGGGGYNTPTGFTFAPGGVGGGGRGAYFIGAGYQSNAVAGTQNSGGGGGAGNAGGAAALNPWAAGGGSGVVIFRYPANISGDITRSPTGLIDTNFKHTMFLLSGQTSISTATNNSTIIDNSYNNLSIIKSIPTTSTILSTIAQGTFSPYGQTWSTYFNGSTDYLTFASTGTQFASRSIFGGSTNTFTIEAWLNPNGTQLSNTATVILGDAQPVGPGLTWSVGLDTTNKPLFYWKDSTNNNNYFVTATNALSTGTWNHVAWVSDAGTPAIYINGLYQLTTSTGISTLTNTTQTSYGTVIGANFNKFYNGFISNLRVAKSKIYSPDLRSINMSASFNGSNFLTIQGTGSIGLANTQTSFTLETWVYPNVLFNQVIISSFFQSSVNIPFVLGTWNATPIDGNGPWIGINWYTTTFGWNGLTTTTTLNLNVWQHIAAVYNGPTTTISLYLNGILIGSRNMSGLRGWLAAATTPMYIGAAYNGAAAFTGQISNFRLVIGTAIYTSNFIPSLSDLPRVSGTQILALLTTNTTYKDNSANNLVIDQGGTGYPFLLAGSGPFTASTVLSFIPPISPLNAAANTVLLTCNNYAHIDNSTSSFTISNGATTSNPRIQKYSPFTLGYGYSPLTIGNSVCLNGTNDYLYTTTGTNITLLTLNGTSQYLSISNATSGPLDLATGALDWTVELWFKSSSLVSQQVLFWKDGVSGSANPSYGASIYGGTTLQWIVGGTGGGAGGGTSRDIPTTIVVNTWYHFALIRNGNWLIGYLNGVADIPINISWTLVDSGNPLTIGAAVDASPRLYFPGNISNFRVVKGTAVYATNTNFTPPITDLTTVTNTQLLTLLSTTSTVISDVSTNTLAISLVGSPVLAISYSLPPVTTSSYVTTFLQLDSDFTIECWAYTTSSNIAQCIFDTAGHFGSSLRPNSFSLNMTAAGLLNFNYNNITSANSSFAMIPFTWNHIAVTRVSGYMTAWLNGSSVLILANSIGFSTGQLVIGKNGPTNTLNFAGFISDFRIVKGQSLYNGNFNPPVAPLKPIDTTTSTSLLLNFKNISILDSSIQHNIITINSATISNSIIKYNSKSVFLSGVADSLRIIPNSVIGYALGTLDFTVEMWINVSPQTQFPNATNLQAATVRSIFDMRTTNTANNGFDIFLNNTGTISVSTLNTIWIYGTTFINTNIWYHLALVRKSNVFTLYLNGIPEGSTFTSATPNFTNPTMNIGFGAAGVGYFRGYIDDLRITRGVARYSSAFLVPQKSLPVK